MIEDKEKIMQEFKTQMESLKLDVELVTKILNTSFKLYMYLFLLEKSSNNIDILKDFKHFKSQMKEVKFYKDNF